MGTQVPAQVLPLTLFIIPYCVLYILHRMCMLLLSSGSFGDNSPHLRDSTPRFDLLITSFSFIELLA
jgi:hypothetical protein